MDCFLLIYSLLWNTVYCQTFADWTGNLKLLIPLFLLAGLYFERHFLWTECGIDFHMDLELEAVVLLPLLPWKRMGGCAIFIYYFIYYYGNVCGLKDSALGAVLSSCSHIAQSHNKSLHWKYVCMSILLTTHIEFVTQLGSSQMGQTSDPDLSHNYLYIICIENGAWYTNKQRFYPISGNICERIQCVTICVTGLDSPWHSETFLSVFLKRKWVESKID